MKPKHYKYMRSCRDTRSQIEIENSSEIKPEWFVKKKKKIKT